MTFRRQKNTENKHKKTNHDCKQMLNDYKDTEMTIKGNLQPIKVIKRPQNKEKQVIRGFFNLVKYRISKKMTKTITKETKRYKKDKHDTSETQTEQ